MQFQSVQPFADEFGRDGKFPHGAVAPESGVLCPERFAVQCAGVEIGLFDPEKEFSGDRIALERVAESEVECACRSFLETAPGLVHAPGTRMFAEQLPQMIVHFVDVGGKRETAAVHGIRGMIENENIRIIRPDLPAG